MADLVVKIEYKSPTRDLMAAALNVTFPFWGIVSPLMAFAGLFNLFIWLVGSQSTTDWKFVSVGIACLAISLFSLSLRWWLSRSIITLDNNGIQIPLLSENVTASGFLPWSTISKVGIYPEAESDWKKKSLVLFRTDKKPNLKIKLSRLEPEQLEQMLLSIDAWGDGLEKELSISSTQDQIRAISTAGNTNASYTDMWEDELRRRFLSTAFMPIEPGALLRNGSLKILRQLAMGGLSAVYLAQLNQKDLVVLKEAVIPEDAVDNVRKKAQEMFEREAALLLKLDNPGIVKVLDYFVDTDRHYLMLEHVNGQDTRQLVKQNGPPRESIVVDWALQIVTALKYLHEQERPIIHRDLTPDNIVKEDDGTIKIIDFGAANEFIGTATGTMVGKQAYIAPEQLRGKTVTQSDLYSLGCTIYFYLTGKEPEALSTSDPRELNPEVSKDLAELVIQLTQMEASDRYQSAAQLVPVLKMISASLSALR